MRGRQADRPVASLLIVLPVVVLFGLGLLLLSRGESGGAFLLALAVPTVAISVYNWRRDFRDSS
jgi:hypothetical protein